MSIKKEKRGKLSREILGLSGVAAAISIFFFGFLSFTANSLVAAYSEKYDILYDEGTQWAFESWIQSVSFVAAVVLFVILFLALVGTRMSYLRKIIQGIEALRTHRMDYEIPLEGNNEFTELAESINYLSKTECELQLKEKQMREEKEGFIRALSHDIRTPLTAILSYSEYMSSKEKLEKQEMDDYILLMQQKAQQIKSLTDQLLDGSNRVLEKFENGKFLMEQLTDEWAASLEDTFQCQIDQDQCPSFSGEFNIQELRRIFDNLASNVEKYADPKKEISLKIYEKEDRLCIEQKNYRKEEADPVESYKIGIESIRKIAQQYGGSVEVQLTEKWFSIMITLLEIR